MQKRSKAKDTQRKQGGVLIHMGTKVINQMFGVSNSSCFFKALTFLPYLLMLFTYLKILSYVLSIAMLYRQVAQITIS